MPIKTFHGDSIPFPLVSVVIPARNEESNISRTLRGITRQCPSQTELQVIVVDDGSSDRTAVKAKRAGATVVSLPKKISGGNPAIARNVGFNPSQGDPLIFLDGNRVPREGWLNTLLKSHRKGVEFVGGSFGKPDNLTLTVQCDYYCGWYHHHPDRPIVGL